jgi:SAM-dependent methyltransferase
MEPTFYEDYYRHENSHWWFRWRYDLIRRLVSDLSRDSDFRILDAGCGTGQMTKHLETLGHAVGLDSAEEAITYAKARGVDRLVRGSITAPPFADGSFDCVLALDVIEHVDDDMGLLSSMVKVLKPGGHLIVTVPAFQALWSEHDEINRHKRRYRAPQLRRLVEEAGFTVDRITYCNTALYAPVFVTRKLKNAVRSITGSSQGRTPRSDLGDHTRTVNEALYQLMRTETRLMRWMDLPFGVSILAIASRPVSDVPAEAASIADGDPTAATSPAGMPELVGAGADASFRGELSSVG